MWSLGRFRLPRPDGSVESTDLPVRFIRHLERALGRLSGSAELQGALERFQVLPPIQQDRELPAVYLQLERAIAEATKVPLSQVHAEACRALATHFAPLLSRPDFALIFTPSGEQERRLCQRLLAEAVAQATQLLGAAGGDFLRSLAAWLDDVPDAPLPVPFELRSTVPTRDSEWVALFYRLARQLFLYLEHKLGEACARSFFERGYDEVARRYGSLDTFPVVVHLLPERLLDSEKLSRLSQSQIQKVLLQKLDDLNDINTRLQSQYEELDATRRELIAARDDLEQRVEERTSELRETNEQLRCAKDKAESADRAKTEFLASMSHELRTPLNAVIGYSEILLEDAGLAGREEEVSDLQKINTAGKQLLSLVDEVLDLSKIEAGKMEIDASEFDLDRFIDDAIATCRPMIAAKGNELVVERPRELGGMIGDAKKLRQAVLNLLSNAGKFTKNGRVTLSVAQEMGAAGSWLEIAVRDTGVGISPENLQRLFQNFTKIGGAGAHKYGGTGLGLALSRKLCRLMGGDISVESELDLGSCFTITVPAFGGSNRDCREPELNRNTEVRHRNRADAASAAG